MRGKKGFTLIEMMIVILVIGVLATIVGLAVKNSGKKSKNAALRAHVETLQNAVELYNNDCGSYPSSLSAVTATSGPAGYDGPYTRLVPPHPWGGSYALDSTTGNVTATPGLDGSGTYP